MSDHTTSDEPYLLVEEVAERLGLPLSVLLHRVEAGDIPARRVERADGLHYALRLGDLGIELDDRGLRSSAIEEETPPPAAAGGEDEEGEEEETLTTAFEWREPTVENAIFSAFDSGPAPVPGRPNGSLGGGGRQAAGGEDEEEAGARWPRRPREPQQPPVWLTGGPGDVEEGDDVPAAAEASEQAGETEDYLPPVFTHDPEEVFDVDQDTAVAELAVPPPSRQPTVSLVDSAATTPRGDLASMSLDARELVAGLLDRWERTLEQRIYTEQRQRFQAELVARQNMVKQLQMELHTARAEHAAAQAEKDRLLAGKERELADRERDLAQTRRQAEEAERLIAPASRRRRWFWSRDD